MVRDLRLDDARLGAADGAGQEQIVDPLHGLSGGVGEAVARAALAPRVAVAGRQHAGDHGRSRLRIEIPPDQQRRPFERADAQPPQQLFDLL
jgi:hypothetical protein